jgi:hypothetical protein
MKRNIVLVIVTLIIILIVGMSCGSFPPEFSRSWSMPDREEINGTVWIASVSADKAGGWVSLEKETAGLLPLIFMDEGYLCVPEQDGADFAVEAMVREREYMQGWKTRASLSIDVFIWPGSYKASQSSTPIAAGRVTAQGNISLSSSKTLNNMLEKAVKKAVKVLEKR